jgi:hypothetical protein
LDLRRERGHAFATRRTGAYEDESPDKVGCIQSDLLSDHSADREPEDIHLLGAQRNAGMQLTESFAMLPASSVSGFYLSHPESSYFAVGKIGRAQENISDQYRDLAICPERP